MGPILRPYQKFFVTFLFAMLITIGIGSGLYVNLSVSPQQHAKMFYNHAWQYYKRAQSDDVSLAVAHLYQSQARYYLHQAGLYDASYDPNNLMDKMQGFKTAHTVTVSRHDTLPPLAAAMMTEQP